MSRASVWLIRVALLFFAAGSGLGSWMLAAKGGALPGVAPWVFPLHVDLMLFGWTLLLVFGVAHWILPRPPGEARDVGVWRVWAAAAALVLGIGCIAVAAGVGADAGRGWELAGRVLEVIAAAIFARHAWRRVRPYGVAAAGPR